MLKPILLGADDDVSPEDGPLHLRGTPKESGLRKNPTTANPTIGFPPKPKAPTVGGGLPPPPHTGDCRGAGALELPAGEGLWYRKHGFQIYQMVGFTMVGWVGS